MKKDIHPIYYKDAVAKCACGATYTAGSTVPEVSVEICAGCHPFFTGRQKLVDTAGRVDRFKARMEAAKKYQEATAKKTTKKAEPKTEKTEDK